MRLPLASVFIGLGSNVQAPPAQLAQALSALSALPETELLLCSPWYKSEFIPSDGPTAVSTALPPVLNAVALIDTRLPAHRLLRHLQRIEHQQGRARSSVSKDTNRTLDLDLLLYGNRCFQTHKLTVPHPRMTTRAFVLYPLLDISPDARLPSGEALTNYLDGCQRQALERWLA